MSSTPNPFELGPEQASPIQVELDAIHDVIDDVSSIPPPVQSEFERNPSTFRRLFGKITSTLDIFTVPSFKEALRDWNDTMQDSVGSIAGIATLLGDEKTRLSAGKLAIEIELDPAIHGFEWLLALELKDPKTEHESGTPKEKLVAHFNQLPEQYRRSAYYLMERLYGDALDATAVRDFYPSAVSREPAAYMSKRELHEHASFTLSNLGHEDAQFVTIDQRFKAIVSTANTLSQLQRRGKNVDHDIEELERIIPRAIELTIEGEEHHNSIPLHAARKIGALHNVLSTVLPQLDALTALGAQRLRYNWNGWDDYNSSVETLPRTGFETAALLRAAPNLDAIWERMTDQEKCKHFVSLSIDNDVEKMTTFASDLPLHFRLHGLFILLATRQMHGEEPLPQAELTIDLEMMATQSKIANHLWHIFDDTPNSRLSQPALHDLREYLGLGLMTGDDELRDVARRIMAMADEPEETLALLESAAS